MVEHNMLLEISFASKFFCTKVTLKWSEAEPWRLVCLNQSMVTWFFDDEDCCKMVSFESKVFCTNVTLSQNRFHGR